MRSVCGGSTRAVEATPAPPACRALSAPPGPNSVSGSGRSHPRVHADSGRIKSRPCRSSTPVAACTAAHSATNASLPQRHARSQGRRSLEWVTAQREVCIASSFELSAWGIGQCMRARAVVRGRKHSTSTGGLSRGSALVSALVPPSPKMRAVIAITNWEGKCVKRFRPIRGRHDAICTGLGSGEAPLDEVDAASHRREMNAFRCGASLDSATSDVRTRVKNSIAAPETSRPTLRWSTSRRFRRTRV